MLRYVSPEYNQRLQDLAETLMADRRQKVATEAGQLALFEMVQGDE